MIYIYMWCKYILYIYIQKYIDMYVCIYIYICTKFEYIYICIIYHIHIYIYMSYFKTWVSSHCWPRKWQISMPTIMHCHITTFFCPNMGYNPPEHLTGKHVSEVLILWIQGWFPHFVKAQHGCQLDMGENHQRKHGRLQIQAHGHMANITFGVLQIRVPRVIMSFNTQSESSMS